MSRQYFFRNDDIRNTLDESLVRIQQLFTERSIPITHAVEPANVTPEVVDWLLSVKENSPHLITIMQHGYDHTSKNTRKKGEFGGDRTYQEQYRDIHSGKELMDANFGDSWFHAFSFPYAPYNSAAIQALQDMGYKVFNSHYNIEWKRRLLYAIGHLLGKGRLFDRHVSWNMKQYPGTTMYEVSMNIGFIRRYHNEQTDCDFCSYEELCALINRYLRSHFPIGVLLHHRYHVTEESLQLISRVFDYLDSKGGVAVSMEQIYMSLEGENGTK